MHDLLIGWFSCEEPGVQDQIGVATISVYPVRLCLTTSVAFLVHTMVHTETTHYDDEQLGKRMDEMLVCSRRREMYDKA